MALFPVAANQAQLSSVVPAASDVFVSGILIDGAYTLARAALAGGVGFVNGLLRTALGQVVCVDATAGLPAGTIFQNGLPLDPTGALCVSTAPVFTWQSGLPYAASGAICSPAL